MDGWIFYLVGMATKTANPELDVKAAVDIATRYLLELFPKVPAHDVSLEEVEFDNNGWHVTLGFTDPSIPRLLSGRIYKIFLVSKGGVVKSMKIRNP
jgi:hypothetical protein